ncbi:hypothetical protein CP981_01270 [Streptomyces platensis]|uniref:Uncharacterized protein n=1 Tax=Streptomyces platensis TaxID=58346 RepID=A0AAE6ND56_STRPT|nr:hypothetical protein [Streptomyces platensis]OSY41660.1 hypothetical protein BG653_05023 [Streptomyces platensis]QEV50487.1 hypothetical protein CP981_01270 [Streptomyces platensis]
MASATTTTPAATPRRAVLTEPGYQAFGILRTGFIVAPILFGLDKFANLLVDWPVAASTAEHGTHLPGIESPAWSRASWGCDCPARRRSW